MGPRTAAAYPDSLFKIHTPPPPVSHRNTVHIRKNMFWSIFHLSLLFKVPGISGRCQGHSEIRGDDATAGQVRDDFNSPHCTVFRQASLYVLPHKRARRRIKQRDEEARTKPIRYCAPHLSRLSWTGGVEGRFLSSKRRISKRKSPV